jgi:quercetin dioxygenase-like cupin family protein
MKRTTLLVAVGVTFLLALGGCSAMGSSSSEEDNSPKDESETPVTATPLSRGTLGVVKAEHDGITVESGPGSADVVTVKVVIKPGGSTGWHHHPGVTLVSVASGTATQYHEDCHKTVLKAGDGFFESAGEPHVVRNEGNVEAVLYPTFVIPTETASEKLTITDPQPKNCDVK